MEMRNLHPYSALNFELTFKPVLKFVLSHSPPYPDPESSPSRISVWDPSVESDLDFHCLFRQSYTSIGRYYRAIILNQLASVLLFSLSKHELKNAHSWYTNSSFSFASWKVGRF